MFTIFTKKYVVFFLFESFQEMMYGTCEISIRLFMFRKKVNIEYKVAKFRTNIFSFIGEKC